MTGKKSRYIPIEDWKDFETYGDGGLETVKYMFGFCQYSGGLYYGLTNDLAPPRELKKIASEAKGVDGGLVTLEEYFKRHAGQ